MKFDTVIHGGTLATATDTFRADIGITNGRIAAIAEALSGGARRIEATDRLVLPGGPYRSGKLGRRHVGR
jgi:dihydropyrimidinase